MHLSLPLQKSCPADLAPSYAENALSSAPGVFAGEGGSERDDERLKKGMLRHGGSGGFTLVEIALAMAIFSFALVSMLGLLSVGLKNSRKASIQIAAANILSTIAADIQGADISKAANGAYTTTSRKLKITTAVLSTGSVQITSPQPLIVDEACSPTNPADGPGLLKTFRVTISSAEPGVQAVRVQIRWPSTTPDTAQPEGSLDSLVALPSP